MYGEILLDITLLLISRKRKRNTVIVDGQATMAGDAAISGYSSSENKTIYECGNKLLHIHGVVRR